MHQNLRRTSRFDHRPLPAWSVSVLMHMALILLLGIFLQRVPQGVRDDASRTVGIVLRHISEDREWFEGEDNQSQDADRSPTQSTAEEMLNALPVESAAASATAASSLPTLGPGANEQSPIGDAGDMLRGGGGSRGLPGGAARVRVFGAEGVGNSFLYLFDRSASMEGSPLAAAKRELLQSLHSLDSTHQFHILFFNNDVRAWDLTGGQNRVAFASDRNKELAARFVGGITASGGTDRRAALLHALAFRADVIFFLTDEDFEMSLADLDRVTDKNRGHTAVNCIEFGRGPSHGKANFLVELARRNGGQYVYVDTRLFGR